MNDFKTYAITVIETELKAIKSLLAKVDDNFANACKKILSCEGRVIVTGMGKSGHIGRKIAATLTSTGTPAFFMHPGEASHGDLGMITKQDVVLAISNSGSTKEILTILPTIKRIGVPLIAITGNDASIIAKEATININLNISLEACPLNLVPTASTTAALVMGDALAISLLKTRGFTKEDFAMSHPAGRLGRRLLLRVNDIMRTGTDIPQVKSKTLLSDALVEISQKRLGMTAITNNNNEMIGMFTDGDLRRTLDQGMNVHQTTIDNVMTQKFTTIPAEHLAIEALNIMEKRKINGFFVVDQTRKVIGAFNLHDLLQAGVV